MLLNCLFVGCGGFIGSVLRYLCGFIRFDDVSFPVTTMGINIIGSFLIMFIAGALLHQSALGEHWQLLLRVGLCGGFTTFSTFSAETLGLLEQGNYALGAAYAIASVALCVGAAFLGEAVSR